MEAINPAEAAQNRGPETLAVIGALAVIAALFTFLRLLSRRMSKTALWIDDYFILLALVFCITLVGLAIQAVSSGTGQHIEILRPHAALTALKLTWASQFLYTWCLAAVKISILMQLWRIFSIIDTFRITVYLLTALVVFWTIATTATGLAECRPIHAFWNSPASTQCISAEKYLFANAIPNILTNAIMMVVPVPLVMRLPIKSWQRAGVIITFALGCLTIIVSIYRVTVVYKHKSSPDITWSFTDIIIWSAVEYSVAIVCANIPALAPLMRSLLRRAYHSRRVSSLRQSVVYRFSTPPGRRADKVAWLQQPSPVAESEMRLNRCYEVGDRVVRKDHGVLMGNEYRRGVRAECGPGPEEVDVSFGGLREVEEGRVGVVSTPVLTKEVMR